MAAPDVKQLFQGVDKGSFAYRMLNKLGWSEGRGLVRARAQAWRARRAAAARGVAEHGRRARRAAAARRRPTPPATHAAAAPPPAAPRRRAPTSRASRSTCG